MVKEMEKVSLMKVKMRIQRKRQMNKVKLTWNYFILKIRSCFRVKSKFSSFTLFFTFTRMKCIHLNKIINYFYIYQPME